MKKIIDKGWLYPLLTKTSLKMKLTTLLLVVSLFKIQANTYSQNTKISINLNEVSVSQVFNEIESLTEFRFLYKDSELDQKRKVSINVKKQSIKKILNKLFKDTKIVYDVFDNRQIVLRTSSEGTNAIVNELKVNAQSRTITGTVTSKIDNQPLPGVNIVIKGAKQGTQTDFDGKYSIAVPTSGTSVLKFMYVGMATVEITVGSASSYNVSLEEAANNLDEVVVTALGLKKEKKTLGYAIQTVKGEDLEKSQELNVINALQGRVAGVQITQADGGVGGTTSIVIRGGNNLGTDRSDQPLIVVDGVPIVNNDTNIGDSGRDWGSGINAINPSDIEEMVVLKGANAAALYGADAANGVILITTKSGKSGAGLGVSYDYSFKADEAYGFRDVQNEFGIGYNGWNTAEPFAKNADGDFIPPSVSFWGSGASWGAKMDGTTVRWYDGELRPYTPQPQNLSEGFQTGYTERHNIAFSGGSEKATFRASVSDSKSTSIYPNTGYDKKNVSFNGSVNLSDKITARAIVNYSEIDHLNAPLTGDNGNGFGKALLYNWARSEKFDVRLNNYKNADGSRNASSRFGRDGDILWNTFEQFENRLQDRLIGSLSINWELADWLSLMLRSGVDHNNRRKIYKKTPWDLDGLKGNYATSLGRDRVNKNEFLFTASKQINDDIVLSSNFGGSEDTFDRYNLDGGNWSGFSNPFIYATANNDGDRKVPGEDFGKRIGRSIYGTLDFGYRDYLFIQLTGRNDWSSTLPDGDNSYFYPSVSGSFVFTDAFDLTESLPWLSTGKFRASWAKSSVGAGYYQLDQTYGIGNWAGLPTASVKDELPPLSLLPQHTASFETGLDLTLFENKVSVAATYYSKSSTNQILKGDIPASSGHTKKRYNSGELSNKGFELTVNAFPIRTEDFKWEVLFNYFKNTNKVEQLDTSGGIDVLNLGGQWGGNGPAIEARAGESYGSIMGWDYIRDEATGKVLVDEDGYPYNTPKRVKLGDASAKWFGGLINTFTYKNFSLNSVIDIKWGGDMWFGSKGTSDGFGQSTASLYGRDAARGGLAWTDGNGNARNDGLIIENALVSPTTPIWNEGTQSYDYTTAGENTSILSAYHYHAVQASGWGAGSISTNSIHENTWVRLTELSFGYRLPQSVVASLGVQNVSLNIYARNLLFLYKTAPDNLNPAGGRSPGKLQGIEFASLPFTRQFGVNFKVSL